MKKLFRATIVICLLILGGSYFFFTSKNGDVPESKNDENSSSTVDKIRGNNHVLSEDRTKPEEPNRSTSDRQLLREAPTSGAGSTAEKEGGPIARSQLPGIKDAQRPDSSLIGSLTSAAWTYSNKYDLHSPSFDPQLEQEASSVARWTPYKNLRNGIYDAVFILLSKTDVSFPLTIYLSSDVYPGLIKPVWIRWYSDEGDPQVQDVSNFMSPFTEHEIYHKSIHFPGDAFSMVLDGSLSCMEILAIPFMETSTDLKSIETVSFRCYCRRGLNQITAVGQLAIGFQK